MQKIKDFWNKDKKNKIILITNNPDHLLLRLWPNNGSLRPRSSYPHHHIRHSVLGSILISTLSECRSALFRAP